MITKEKRLGGADMIVTSTGIVNGVIEEKYGANGTQFNENGMPSYSLPLKIEGAPDETVSFAIVLDCGKYHQK